MTRFYRVVHDEKPAIDDFKSNEALGLISQSRMTRRQQEGWRAVSMYSTLEEAEALSHEAPAKGDWVAVLDLPEDGNVRWERQGQNPNHYNVWAEPELLRSYVVDVLRPRQSLGE